ncbi:PAB-dependent poly(A)-specific ribonuclease subunit 3 [Dimargaris cristalligena]|nr:PAB-dependent poly(A)-specific ribonuclease subunit 3 [Dimargaris cristalligena]
MSPFNSQPPPPPAQPQLFRFRHSITPVRIARPDSSNAASSSGPAQQNLSAAFQSAKESNGSTPLAGRTASPSTTPAAKGSSVTPFVLSPHKPPFVPNGIAAGAAATPDPNAKPRLCRNVIIFGCCKFEGKGCVFSHEPEKPSDPLLSKSPERKGKLPDPSSPVFTPRKYKKAPFSEQHATTPAFHLGDVFSPNNSHTPHQINDQFSAMNVDEVDPSQHPDDVIPGDDLGYEDAGHPTAPPFHGPDSHAYTYARTPVSAGQHMIQMARLPHEPLQYHMYSGPPSNVANLPPQQKHISHFFISDTLRHELTEKNFARLNYTSTDPSIPNEVNQYHSLMPLEDTDRGTRGAIGYVTFVYKAQSSRDGLIYALRRIEGFRLMNEDAMSVVETWRKIQHPNIASLYEAFTTTVFDDNSLVLVYDYYPLAVTMRDFYFGQSSTIGGVPLFAPVNSGPPMSPKPTYASPSHSTSPLGGMAPSGAVGPVQHNQSIPEATLWSYVIQLASALSTVHAMGLAFRTITLEHILMIDKHRLSLDRAGILDLVTYDMPGNVTQFQREDLSCIGRILIILACGNLHALTHTKEALAFIQRTYSASFKQVIMYLLGRLGPGRNVEDLLRIVGPRIFDELNAQQRQNDLLQAELSRELENARLVRLLTKFGFINERPEFNREADWSETGDRYLIKLFRDFVFHQVDEHGRPVVDMAHVLTCLNKLDAGVSERVMLTSRDEQSCLIVSYRDIKQCIENAFHELQQ